MHTYTNIPDAWYQSNILCIREGYTYTIERGSYVGQQRKQLAFHAFEIVHPETKPLGITYDRHAISDDDSIYAYFINYLIAPKASDKEQYTYGDRIYKYIDVIANMLHDTPNTNQAIIEIAQPQDILLPDPPCLRLISFKVIQGILQMTTFWRSWDAFNGLPDNLGGLQLFFEMIGELADIPTGRQICVSDGIHIYDHAWRYFL